MSEVALLSKSVFLICCEHSDKLHISPKETQCTMWLPIQQQQAYIHNHFIPGIKLGQPQSLAFPPPWCGRKSQCHKESSCLLQCLWSQFSSQTDSRFHFLSRSSLLVMPLSFCQHLSKISSSLELEMDPSGTFWGL